MENSTGIAALIFRYIRKDLTPAEADQLQRWVQQSDKNRLFFEEVTQPGYLFTEARIRDELDRDIDKNEAWQKLVDRGIPTQEYYYMEPPSSRKQWFAAAAVLFLCALAGWYFWPKPQPPVQPPVVKTTPKRVIPNNDLVPAIRRATLTLADGSTVVLDSAQDGVLAMEGNTAVTKTGDGRIVYGQAASDQPLLYNTLSVPRGSNVVHITLSDGTRVWLNAASSLHYPVAFTGNERKVEITGEAYFEVAHNEAAPFKVSKGNMQVAVLGTHFNVNAYHEEEAIKVTLLQGSVAVSLMNAPAGQEQQLRPGQQALVKQSDVTVSSRIDQEAIMAWKNGLFYFDNTNIDVIVRQIERWYDVSIEYDPALKNVAFNGQISRYSNASEVLEMLETAEALHYRIDNRKIYLSPYTK
jgi:transmembrane sensor